MARTDVHITFQPSEIDGAVSSACFPIVLNHLCLPRRSGANAEGAGMAAVDLRVTWRRRFADKRLKCPGGADRGHSISTFTGRMKEERR
jgi:hypothetical protein